MAYTLLVSQHILHASTMHVQVTVATGLCVTMQTLARCQSGSTKTAQHQVHSELHVAVTLMTTAGSALTTAGVALTTAGAALTVCLEMRVRYPASLAS